MYAAYNNPNPIRSSIIPTMAPNTHRLGFAPDPPPTSSRGSRRRDLCRRRRPKFKRPPHAPSAPKKKKKKSDPEFPLESFLLLLRSFLHFVLSLLPTYEIEPVLQALLHSQRESITERKCQYTVCWPQKTFDLIL